jgi:hypothetical protein
MAGVDGFLDRGGVDCRSVAHGTVGTDVEDLEFDRGRSGGGGVKCGHGTKQEGGNEWDREFHGHICGNV